MHVVPFKHEVVKNLKIPRYKIIFNPFERNKLKKDEQISVN